MTKFAKLITLLSLLLIVNIDSKAQFTVERDEEHDRKENEYLSSLSFEEQLKYLDKSIAEADKIYDHIASLLHDQGIGYDYSDTMATHCADQAQYQVETGRLGSKEAKQWAVKCAIATLKLRETARLERVDQIAVQLADAVSIELPNVKVMVCASEAEQLEYIHWKDYRNREIYIEKILGNEQQPILSNINDDTLRNALNCYLL